MPKKRRLAREDFKTIRSKRREEGVFFTLYTGVVPRGEGGCACVVSKKVAAHATDRNKIRRRCREILRNLPQIQGDSRSYVFHAKRSSKTASYVELGEDIRKLITQAEKYKKMR